jgi:hypothetical protein
VAETLTGGWPIQSAGTCRSCRSPIVWCRTHERGQIIPVDPDPREDGNLERVEGNIVRVSAQATDLFGGDRYVSHFATCPDAEEWRREHGVVRLPAIPAEQRAQDPTGPARLAGLLARVHNAMSDGRWWTLHDLSSRTGGSEASVSARIRDLRKPEYGAHRVERRGTADAGIFMYRLVTEESP